MPCLRLCEVDEHADGAHHAADEADFDVADDQAGVDDALDDVVDDKADGDISITIKSSISNSATVSRGQRPSNKM